MHRNILLVLFIASAHTIAHSACTLSNIKIGTLRGSALTTVRQEGCKLKLDESGQRLEDDIVLADPGDKYDYYELIFIDGKLGAVWTYFPLFTSAEKAFSALFEELVTHSTPFQAAKGSGKLADSLGARNVAGKVLLERPLSQDLGLEKIKVDVDDGTIFMTKEPAKDATMGIRVGFIRSR